ncbi:DUF192 domain-containing protein [Marinobacter sp.]|uniref:DUF192 domain-containing protein n=1 Tax=Marinobacter sp. TaxID=50741 RepID=UPI003563BFDE
MGQPAQSDLDNKSQSSIFDHWISVLGIIALVSFIGAGLGIFAGIKLESLPSNRPIPAPPISTENKTSAEQSGDSLVRSIFARVSGCIITARDEISVIFYIADTPELRQRGLQGVPGLPKNHGMLFVYDTIQPSESQFWMYQTPMNLDISYLDSEGQIQSIQQMQACSLDSDSCPRYKAGIPFKAAAEFPQGFYRANGITVGDRISLNAFGSCGNP